MSYLYLHTLAKLSREIEKNLMIRHQVFFFFSFFSPRNWKRQKKKKKVMKDGTKYERSLPPSYEVSTPSVTGWVENFITSYV